MNGKRSARHIAENGGLDVELLEGRVLLSAAFGAAQTFAVGTNPDAIASGDVNGDGHVDLVTVNYSDFTGNAVSVLLGNGNGTFQAATSFSLSSVGPKPTDIQLADVNGDSKLDIVAVESSNHLISVLLNNGNGTFKAAQTTAMPSPNSDDYPNLLVVTDLNGDHKADLVVAGSQGDLGILLGNGDGTFRGSQANIGGGYFNSLGLAAGDVNGDGHPDIVTTDSANDSMILLLGNGDGTFQAAQTLFHGEQIYSVAIADVNGDGHQDVVATVNLAQKAGTTDLPAGLLVLLGNGNGTFEPYQVFDIGQSPYAMSLGEINGDGHLDAAVISRSGVTVLLGAGDGTFENVGGFDAGKGRALTLADVNGDNKPDMILGNGLPDQFGEYTNTVTVRLNQSDTTAPFATQSNHVLTILGSSSDDTISAAQVTVSSTFQFTATLNGVTSPVFTGITGLSVAGGAGNDTIAGVGLSDSLPVTMGGGGGNDQITGGAEADVLRGGKGADTLAGAGNNDTIVGGGDNDSLKGGGGDDSIQGGPGDDVLHGGVGNDSLYGGIGNDTMAGNGDNDSIIAGSGSSSLSGGPGNDTLVGSTTAGYGADTLSGGGDGGDVIDAGTGDLLA